MNPLSVPMSARRGLVIDASYTLVECIIDTWNRMSSTPQEPDFVADIVLQGTPKLEQRWRKRLNGSGLSISVGGVFCHQSPKVKYSGMRQRSSCEIGDLLWIHSHSFGGKVVRRNALLYQAKKSASQSLNINPNDDQLRLYMQWPDFTYVRSSGLTGYLFSV